MHASGSSLVAGSRETFADLRWRSYVQLKRIKTVISMISKFIACISFVMLTFLCLLISLSHLKFSDMIVKHWDPKLKKLFLFTETLDSVIACSNDHASIPPLNMLRLFYKYFSYSLQALRNCKFRQALGVQELSPGMNV